MFESETNVLAAWIYRHSKVVGVPAPLTMALELGLQLIALPVGGGATLVGESIIWDPTTRLSRQQALVLREMCRWVLREHGLQNDTDEGTSLAVAFNSYASRRLNVRQLAARVPDSSQYRRPLVKASSSSSSPANHHPVLRSGTHPALPRSR